MNGQFEWTESGELLLGMIENSIFANGGREKLADMMTMESPEFFPVEEVNASRRRLKKFDLKNILVKKSAAFEKQTPVIDRRSSEYYAQFYRSGRPKAIKYNNDYNEYGFVQILPKRPQAI